MPLKSLVGAVLSPIAWGAAGLAATVLLYALAALLLGLVPVNRDFRPPPQGVEIFVRSNGIHADLVFPATHELMNWRVQHPGAHFATPAGTPGGRVDPAQDPRFTHVAFGWGDRGFYFETPQWSDLTPGVALKALSGTGAGTVHVEYESLPAPGPRVRRLLVSPAQYRRLIDHLQAEFERGPDGALIPFAGRGYTPHDTFYAARSSYNMVHTCNEWVRRGLAHAGVKVPLWSPFPWALLAMLD